MSKPQECVGAEQLAGLLEELVEALKKSRCEYCGYLLSAPRGDCKVCAERVAILAKAEAK